MKQNRLVRFGILIASIVFCLTNNAQAQVGWQLSGNNDEYITSGKVGIGTTQPQSLLHITSVAPIITCEDNVGGNDKATFGETNGYFGFCGNRNYATGEIYDVTKTTAGFDGYVGPSDSHVSIYTTPTINTSPIERMRIDKNGNVGIGTASPGAKLEVARPNDGATIFRISNVGGTGFDFARNNVTGALSIQGNQTGFNNILLAPTSGNVGIGTTSPGYKLDVSGVINTSGGIRFADGTTQTTAGSGGGGQWTTSGSSIYYNTGNVGIGTTTTGSCKLAVEGMIGAREVQVVASDWPDYVFDESYKLTALDEVEQSIKTDKHLPGIPSKEEVVKDGVKLGEMQAKLLQKVEELTLYVIEQNKRIEKLEKENQELSKQ